MPADAAAFVIEPLASRHVRDDFDSSAPDLDHYLKTRAGQDARRRVAAPFVLAAPDSAVAGYYTLSAAAILAPELPDAIRRKLPRYPQIPAVLLGRLAVARRHQGEGLGRHLLADALLRSLRSEVAVFAVVVDARDAAARRFYEHESFQSFPDHPMRLFLPIAQVASLFE